MPSRLKSILPDCTICPINSATRAARYICALAQAMGTRFSTSPHRRQCARRRRPEVLIGIIITACVDHYRAALNVGHGKMWCCNRLRSFAAGINGKHWHIALVTLTLRPEVLASVSRVVMASRGHPSRWLGHLVRWRDRSSD